MGKKKSKSDTIIDPRQHFFSTIFGHQFLKQTLLRIATEKRVPNAFLFYGPPEIGKKSLAYAYVKLLNCQRETKGEQCECRSCHKTGRGIHPDIYAASAAGRSKQVVMDEARRMQELATLPPIEGRKRVVLIPDAEMLNPSAANSLLKILEEPPHYTLFILVTARPYAVLPTIRSRCVQLRLSTPPRAELVRWLCDALRVKPQEAEVAIMLAEGRTGAALRYLSGKLAENRRLSLDDLTILTREGFAALFRTVTNLLNMDESTEEIMSILLAWYRDLLVCRATRGRTELIVNQDAAKQIATIAQDYSLAGLLRSIARIIEYQKFTRRTVHERLMLQVLLSQIGMDLKRSI